MSKNEDWNEDWNEDRFPKWLKKVLCARGAAPNITFFTRLIRKKVRESLF